MTDTQRIATPPGSIIVLRLAQLPLELDDVEPMVAELHRQTGLPVLVTDGTADVDVTTRQEAVEALGQALPANLLNAWGRTGMASAALDALAVEGWELVRLRQP